MTLIAAFRCGRDAVLCADSQETWGDYKVSVSKIIPKRIGFYDLAYAGSGFGALVDSLGDAIEEWLEKSRASGSVSLRNELRALLTKFYRSAVVRTYPVPEGEDKAVTGVVCIRVDPLAHVFLFDISGTTVREVDRYALRGIEAPLYFHIIERLYRPDLSVQQAILLGLHLFVIAGATSRLIGGPTSMVVAQQINMLVQPRDDMEVLQAGVSEVQAAMDALLLTCADLYTLDESLRKRLRALAQSVMTFRKDLRAQSKQAFVKRMKRAGWLIKRSGPPKRIC